MAQRQRTTTQERSPYKYQGIKDENIRPHEECEMNEDGHVVKPTRWPPPRLGGVGGDPSLDLRCTLCGVNLVVYAGHATGELPGVTVILPEPGAEPEARRRPGRPPKAAAE